MTHDELMAKLRAATENTTFTDGTSISEADLAEIAGMVRETADEMAVRELANEYFATIAKLIENCREWEVDNVLAEVDEMLEKMCAQADLDTPEGMRDPPGSGETSQGTEGFQNHEGAGMSIDIDFDSSHESCPLTAEDAMHLFGTPTSWKLWRQGITE